MNKWREEETKYGQEREYLEALPCYAIRSMTENLLSESEKSSVGRNKSK